MTNRRLGYFRTGLSLALLAAAIWYGLDSVRPRASWLTVECPRRIAAGEVAAFRVTLPKLLDSSRLAFDLHGATSKGRSLGFIAGGGTREVGPTISNLVFSVRIPDRADLGFVEAVIYLTRSGRWQDRTQVAFSDPLRVVRASRPVEPTRDEVRRLPVYPPESEVSAPRFTSAGVRSVTAGLLLLAGTAAAAMHRRGVGRAEVEVREPARRVWSWLVVACLFAAVCEAMNLGSALAAWFRSAARLHGLYQQRHGPQQAATVVLAMAVLVSVIRVAGWRTSAGGRLAVLGWLLWFGATSVGAVSLHAVDRLAATGYCGVSLLALAPLSAAALCALGGLIACFSLPPGRRNARGQDASPEVELG